MGMLNGDKATLIQTSLDQSLKVQMENTEDKRRTKYYNKRPAAKKKGAVAMERSACLLTRGASRASSGRIGWSRARWRVERYRMGKRAGTYND
jgi:pyridoxine/pyridoxamine 5'-phosphate oxidase